MRRAFPSTYLILFSVFFTFPSGAYVLFDSMPTQNWSRTIEKFAVEKHYKVQRGDTLYDISKTLFGDENFWPKIWSLNAKFTNPHIIEPGAVVYFQGGSLYSGPTMGVLSKSEVETKYEYGSSLLSPEIPPASIGKGPIPIPSSLPSFFNGLSVEEGEKALERLAFGKRLAYEQSITVPILTEVSALTPTVVASVVKVESGGEGAREGEFIVVKAFSSLASGQDFNVFTKTRPSKKQSFKLPKPRPHIIQWSALVRIIQSLNNDEYLARVIKSYDLVRKNSYLTRQSIEKVSLPKEKSFSVDQLSTYAELVGAQQAFDTQAVGEGDVVFINKGSLAGVMPNAIYPVYTKFGNRIAKNRDRETRFFPEPVAYIKIAKVEEELATGVAFRLKKELASEDRVGSY